VYHNPKKNKTFMALRGTNFKDVGDLHIDKHIVDGSQRDHAFFKKDERDYDKVAAKYKGSPVAATGHSEAPLEVPICPRKMTSTRRA
jgi:hypothetical protein